MMETKEFTNSLIKEVAVDAFIDRGVAYQSLDTIFKPGAYQIVPGSTTGLPSWMDYGVLEVLSAASYVVQKYYPRGNWAYAMAWRSGHNVDKDWKAWIFVPKTTYS